MNTPRYTPGEYFSKDRYWIRDAGKDIDAIGTIVAISGMSDECQIMDGWFFGGVFKGGVFSGGTFYGGTFHGGVYNHGVYYSGEFHKNYRRCGSVFVQIGVNTYYAPSHGSRQHFRPNLSPALHSRSVMTSEIYTLDDIS